MNKALDINGVSDNCVILPSSTKLFNSSFTKQFWIYVKKINVRHILIGDYSDTITDYNTGTNLEIYSNNKIRLYWNNGEIDVSFDKIEQNQWTHITWIRDRENNKHIFYKDGNKIFETNTAGKNLSCIGNQYLGKDTRDIIFNGIIDEVRIWDRVLSKEEINKYMNKIISPNSKGLTAYYKFDYDKENIIADLTNNHNDGKIIKLNLVKSYASIEEYRYLIQDKNNILYTLNENDLVQAPSQTLDENNFDNNGFSDISIITKDLLLSKFKNLKEIKLLVYTNDLNKKECEMIYNCDPFRPIDKLKKNSHFCNILFKEV
ncbi:LamG domain-containing protein [Clostridium botulinum]|nr:LamG domain-containing protein [Clostridium botulinum]EKO2042906.1 LamG domain-containing protein [Clostridium botulinum]